jgi:hypothetical protein
VRGHRRARDQPSIDIRHNTFYVGAAPVGEPGAQGRHNSAKLIADHRPFVSGHGQILRGSRTLSLRPKGPGSSGKCPYNASACRSDADEAQLVVVASHGRGCQRFYNIGTFAPSPVCVQRAR